MKTKVYPYKQGSKSAKALATALGTQVLLIEGSKWKRADDTYVINWGNTKNVNHPLILNKPDEIRKASNKLLFFQLLKGSGFTPEFWTSRSEIPDEAFPVVCRKVLSGHSGEGIHIADTRDDLVDAPLYIRYVKKSDEFRIHVGRVPEGTSIIAVQRKARRLDHENPNWQVRNLQGGFVYTRTGFTAPADVIDKACGAFLKTGLDFGAVDVIYNAKGKFASVLEINTAPGLEGQTVTDYANYFRSL